MAVFYACPGLKGLLLPDKGQVRFIIKFGKNVAIVYVYIVTRN